MTYEAQLSEAVRQTIRYGYASNTVSFWPKIAGVGHVAVTGTPTYTLYAPGTPTGGSALASGNATATAVGSVTRCDVTVDASTLAIGSYYRVEVSFVYSSVTYVVATYFDVVREPFLPLVSANDFVDEVSDAETRLAAQASRVESGRTAEQHASMLGLRAWADVQSWLMLRIDSTLFTIAHIRVDKELLRRVVVAQAVARMYLAEGGPEGSEAWSLAQNWLKEAKQRFDSLPPLAYDLSSDLAPDSMSGPFSTFRWRRSW